jgi:hypothetical protein
MSNLIAVNDMQVMAESIVKSGFYGFKTKEQVMAVMLVAQAEGKHPATVVQEYDIIQGRPALKSQALLARFQMSGGKVEWQEVSAKRCCGTFTHPQGGSLTIEWTIDMARQAGLVREGSGWTKYPEDMLTARVISRAVRKVFPGCILGHYAVEEVMDFEPRRNSEPVDMGAVQRVDAESQALQEETLQDDGAFKLYVPGSDEPYKSFYTSDEWIEGYAELVKRIIESQKIAESDKFDKLKKLSEVNKPVTERFDSFHKIKLKAEIVKAGGNVDPKPQSSPSAADSELKEPTF